MKKFEYTPPEQPRELILKLGQKITDRIGHTVTAEDPEYYGLEALVTDEMAEVALKMKVRKPMTLAQAVKATGKEEKVLEELLQEMSNIGLLEYNWENPKHEKQYVLPMYVPGSAEFFNMKLDQIKEHPEVASFFERMAFLPLQKVTPMVPPGGAGIGMHVLPVEKAMSLSVSSIFPTGWINMMENMQQVRVPAVIPAVFWARDARMIRKTGVSVSAIWLTI